MFRSPPPHRKSSGNLRRGKGGKPNKYLPNEWKCPKAGWCNLSQCAKKGCMLEAAEKMRSG